MQVAVSERFGESARSGVGNRSVSVWWYEVTLNTKWHRQKHAQANVRHTVL